MIFQFQNINDGMSFQAVCESFQIWKKETSTNFEEIKSVERWKSSDCKSRSRDEGIQICKL